MKTSYGRRFCHIPPAAPLLSMLVIAAVSGGGVCLAGSDDAESVSTTVTSRAQRTPDQFPGSAPEPVDTPFALQRAAPGIGPRPTVTLGGGLHVGRMTFDHQNLVDKQGSPGTGFLTMYREALVYESSRALRREPYLFWVDEFQDEEDVMYQKAHQRATRIFVQTHRALRSDMLDWLVQATPGIRTVHRYIDGIDFGQDPEPDPVRYAIMEPEMMPAPLPETSYETKFNFVVSTRPRVKMSTWLPGKIRTRVTVPLHSPGVQTTFSRRLTSHLRGTLSAGVEEAGEESWVSAGLRIRF